MRKLHLGILDDFGIREMSAPKRTLGFAGRAEMLSHWDNLDAEKQALLLELARQMVQADEGRKAMGLGAAAKTRTN